MTQPPPPAPDRGESRIVLVGATHYTDPGLADVPQIANNLAELFSLLTDRGLGGFDRQHCVMLPDADLRETGGALTRAAKEAEDLLLFYYSGHGLLDLDDGGALYLSLFNTDQTDLQFSALRFTDVRAAFRRSNARTKIVILDCCFAGQAIEGELGDDILMGRLNINGSYLMASSPGHQPSLVRAGETRTAFSGRLIDLLRTGIPGGEEMLTPRRVFPLLHQRLVTDGLPVPRQAVFQDAADYGLVINRSPGRHIVDPVVAQGRPTIVQLRTTLQQNPPPEQPIGATRGDTGPPAEPTPAETGVTGATTGCTPPTTAVTLEEAPAGGTGVVGGGTGGSGGGAGAHGNGTEEGAGGTAARRWWRRSWPFVAAGVALAVAAGVAVVLTDHSAGSGSHPKTGTPPPSALPPCSVSLPTELVVTASVDVSSILAERAEHYGQRSTNGTCVKVTVVGKDSGLAMTALKDGWKESDGPRPDVWSPASQIWLPLARLGKSPSALALPEAPKAMIATSPLVIAMPQPMADALDWHSQQLGWRDLAGMAHDASTFWAGKGHPTWGPFRLGKTDPRYSTSGLNATVAAFTAAASKPGDKLSADDLDVQANRDVVQDIENATVHYGDTTLTFLANLRRADDSPSTAANREPALNYISAVTVEESAVIAYNLGYPCGTLSKEQPGCDKKLDPPKTKLAAFYPKDGQLASDHPYIEMTGLEPAKQVVADDFLTYLHSAEGQRPFADIGMRGPEGQATDQVAEANWVLPNGPKAPMKPPAPPVADKVLSLWPSLRKPANVLLVLDTSLSMKQPMNGTQTKLDVLKEAAPTLLGAFTDNDRVGLWQFSSVSALGGSGYQVRVPLGRFSDVDPVSGHPRKQALADGIAKLQPDGDTTLYDTTAAAVGALRSSYVPTAIDAVILLTDGEDDPLGKRTPNAAFDGDWLLAKLADPAQNRVRVFTIAYSASAAGANGQEALAKIAEASGGRSYDATTPGSLGQALTAVISNF